jgi:hypothetical protein
MARVSRATYEDADEYTAPAYRVKGYAGVAFRVLGWQTEATEDTAWSGDRERTGQLCVYMVGDDRVFVVDPADVTALHDGDYCTECGQIGCAHGARESE